ncbi:hypothetical protein CcaverHIS002_0405170 [Cutaneotrichosporon cavernicola]|uniref:Uncharacterized protein n=1 Tax=Cutaneotrichosporon cavernicola TaxID=279322 RepID=A0AA48L4B3_9TREE|nr:uncharacterized protein CcaverHIS019_0405130 [Cutaneotrichosporon cavernicola]BEI83913.1 hypothetical protein CcaverHIS002_0405170 [Cutaneotrichosporon cavernicola]BEI91693.1 hypothetical protein CcaverHIS019_0405130 [Cutaneotrichosporon cavernicola]BEI99468.1 hypothetical protein CcaverHIS631_0405110 [Cutaneotrichosporon cavernicola]BEJ07246.1 hypothetical protein CcaverHIS641_0405150 [Cutaneotrichosporon cavernicola]
MFKARSNSTTSVGSTSSTCSTRSTQDMIAHIVAQEPNTIYLWSAGNVRVNGRDLGLDAVGALKLAGAMRCDHRFEFVRIDYLDTEGDEWKASYRVVA